LRKIQVDNAFEEALEALEQKEYEKVRLQFENAENLYKILEDTEKESQCREMIAIAESEMLLEQGKMQYGAKKYLLARKSFIQAKNEFKELGNAKKCLNAKNG